MESVWEIENLLKPLYFSSLPDYRRVAAVPGICSEVGGSSPSNLNRPQTPWQPQSLSIALCVDQWVTKVHLSPSSDAVDTTGTLHFLEFLSTESPTYVPLWCQSPRPCSWGSPNWQNQSRMRGSRLWRSVESTTSLLSTYCVYGPGLSTSHGLTHLIFTPSL